jgi:hypothetical protein
MGQIRPSKPAATSAAKSTKGNSYSEKASLIAPKKGK